jgi:hypothetical protein
LADEEEGGVLGREELEFKESNLSISAWEYAAPTTRPDPWPGGDAIFLLDEELRLSRGGGLQKGDADSDRSTWTISCGDCAGFLPLPEDDHMVRWGEVRPFIRGLRRLLHAAMQRDAMMLGRAGRKVSRLVGLA